MIDIELCENFYLSVHPFTCDISHYVGVEGASMMGSAVAILGWVEVELGIPHMGCILAKFWVTECKYDKGVPIVIGSHQAKRVMAQANLERMDCWPPPWKTVYEWCSFGRWYERNCLDDFYDSDDYEEEESPPKVKQSKGLLACSEVLSDDEDSLSDSWIALAMTEVDKAEEDYDQWVKRTKVLVEASNSTALKGIPDSGCESEEACSAPSARNGPPPDGKEEAKPKGGDELSVFANLALESEGTAEEDGNPTCNLKDSDETEPLTVPLSPFPAVSCRITPTGETILSFQWGPK